MMNLKLNAEQLRKDPASPELRGMKKLKRNDIYIILDNVLDTYNIGSVFRLADAVSAKKIYLCQGTETPPNPRIKKASINTTEWVEWEYAADPIRVIKYLRTSVNNLQVIAIEQSPTAKKYYEFKYKLPVCLIVGNETFGISQNVLTASDAIVEIPLYGINISLNVMVSLAIILYKVVEQTVIQPR